MTDTDIVNTARDNLEINCHNDYKWAAMQIESLQSRVAELEGLIPGQLEVCKLADELEETIERQQQELEALRRLAEPCKCAERIIGMCVPCAMRDQFAGGDSAIEISRDFPLPPEPGDE